MRKKLAVTGASGNVGRMIVPILHDAGIELLLVGRDAARLREAFPGIDATDYEGYSEAVRGFDAVLHLAVLNNNRPASPETFRAINVDFTRQIAEYAQAAGVPLFINATTVHALDTDRTDAYSVSKREGEAALDMLESIRIVHMRLPAVYGDRYSGRLAFMHRVPRNLRDPVLTLFGVLRPMVSAERVAWAIPGLLESGAEGKIILSDPPEQNAAYRLLSRCVDLAFVLVVTVFFWWLLALVWTGVKLTSPGPAIFAQKRVGKGERIFTCYKFRTMRSGTREAGTHEISQSEITPIGRFLRRSKIDELPQTWNILRGDMSLVGPRPCLPSQSELIGFRRALDVFGCKPGITGLAQVAGIDMSEPQKLARIDARYCALRNLAMDIGLVIATVFRR